MGKSLENSMSSSVPHLRRQGRSKSPSTGFRKIATQSTTTISTTKTTDQRNNSSKSSDRRKKPSGGESSTKSTGRSRWQPSAKNKGQKSQSPQINALIRNALNEDVDDSSESHSSCQSSSSSDSSSRRSGSEDSSVSTRDESDDEGMAALMNLYPTTTTTKTGDKKEVDPSWVPLSPDSQDDSNQKKSSSQKIQNMITLATMAHSGSASSDDNSSSSAASSSHASGSDAISVQNPTSDDDGDIGEHSSSAKALSSRKIRFVPKSKQEDLQQQKDPASASSESADFQVTTTSGNISTWEMRQKFKKEFPDDPMPSDDILRQLYRTEKVAEYERQERFKAENPGEPVPSDFVLRKLYAKPSTAAAMTEQSLPPSLDTAGPAASTTMPTSSVGETASLDPMKRTDLLKRMDSGLTFATEAEWEDYKKSSSKSLDAGLGKMPGGKNTLFAFAEEDEDNVEFDAFGGGDEPKKSKPMMKFSQENAPDLTPSHMNKDENDATEAFHSSFQALGPVGLFGEDMKKTEAEGGAGRKKKASKKSIKKNQKATKDHKPSSRGRSSKGHDKEKSSKSNNKHRKKRSESNSSPHRSRSRDKSNDKSAPGSSHHRSKKKEHTSRGRRTVDDDQNMDLNRSGHNRSKHRETKGRRKTSKDSSRDFNDDRGEASHRRSRRTLDNEDSKSRDRSSRNIRSGDDLGAFMDNERGEASVRRGRRVADSDDNKSLDLSTASGQGRPRRRNSRGDSGEANVSNHGISEFEKFANNSFAADSFADPHHLSNYGSSDFEAFANNSFAAGSFSEPSRGIGRSKSESGDFAFGEFQNQKGDIPAQGVGRSRSDTSDFAFNGFQGQESSFPGLEQGGRFFVESKSSAGGPRLAPSRREVLRSRSADLSRLRDVHSPGEPRRMMKSSGTGSGPNTPSAPPKMGLSGFSTPTTGRSTGLSTPGSRHRQKGSATAANSWMAEVPGAFIPQNSSAVPSMELEVVNDVDCISPLTAATRKVVARPTMGRRRGGYR